MVWTARPPIRSSMVGLSSGVDTDHIFRIGMDTSKQIFQLHGVNGAEELWLRRRQMIEYLELDMLALSEEKILLAETQIWDLATIDFSRFFGSD